MMPASRVNTFSSPDSAVQEAVRRIVERVHPERVILFGSRARGTSTPDSDADLLVIMDQEPDGPTTSAMYEAIARLPRVGMAGIDIVAMSRHEFERYKDYIGTVAYPASREGRVLYQRVA